MKPLRFAIAGLMMGGLVAGCAHKTTPEELKAKSDQASASGRDQFYKELVQKNVKWYVGGGQSAGFNGETGLPEVAVSSLPVGMQSSEFVKSHNDAVLEYIRANGSVPGSFLSWEYNLVHQGAYWAMHSGQQPEMLRPGSSVTSADGQFTLTLSAAGGGQLTVKSDSAQHQATAPAGATGASVDILFGPTGSDLAYTRWTSGGTPVYAAMNMRDATWLAIQHGGQ